MIYCNLRVLPAVLILTFFLAAPAHAVVLWEKKVLPQAEKGDVNAQYLLAQMYYNGKGARRNYKKAVAWYTKAAENGHTGAMVDLAWIYRNGIRTIPKDVGKALYYYELAAKEEDPKALTQLAFMYDEGVVVGEDNEIALKYYERAVAAGDPVAMYNLGALYWEGRDVAQDNKRAWTLLNRARTTTEDEELKYQAGEVMDQMKEQLNIKAGVGVYPAWEKLEYRPERKKKGPVVE